jgi:hypothetical protein
MLHQRHGGNGLPILVDIDFAEPLVKKVVDIRRSKEDPSPHSNPEHAWLLPAIALRVERTRGEPQILSRLLECQQLLPHTKLRPLLRVLI